MLAEGKIPAIESRHVEHIRLAVLRSKDLCPVVEGSTEVTTTTKSRQPKYLHTDRDTEVMLMNHPLWPFGPLHHYPRARP